MKRLRIEVLRKLKLQLGHWTSYWQVRSGIDFFEFGTIEAMFFNSFSLLPKKLYL